MVAGHSMDQRKGDIFDIRHPGFQRVDPFGAGVASSEVRVQTRDASELAFNRDKDPMANIASWWFQPLWKILVKLDHFPR